MLRNGRRAVGRALTGRIGQGRLRRALGELAVTIERTATVVAQPRARLAGQMPDGATRRGQPHDPEARPIRKGRIDRPVEFGYKAQVLDNDDGVVLDYERGTRAPPPTARSSCPPSNASAGGQGGCPRGHCRPRLRPGRGRTRPARRGRAHRGDSPPGHHLSRPQDRRARPQLPQARQMAHRMRRPDSATSNAVTAGTAPAWTAGTGQPSGAVTGSSPTTWPRSLPWPADPPQPDTARHRHPATALTTMTFSGRSNLAGGSALSPRTNDAGGRLRSWHHLDMSTDAAANEAGVRTFEQP